MRITALSGLTVLALMAGACGDSPSDDNKKDDDTTQDAGNGDVDAGMLPDLDDGELSGCDKGDPCCFGSDEYDYERCMSQQDAGTE